MLCLRMLNRLGTYCLRFPAGPWSACRLPCSVTVSWVGGSTLELLTQTCCQLGELFSELCQLIIKLMRSHPCCATLCLCRHPGQPVYWCQHFDAHSVRGAASSAAALDRRFFGHCGPGSLHPGPGKSLLLAAFERQQATTHWSQLVIAVAGPVIVSTSTLCKLVQFRQQFAV